MRVFSLCMVCALVVWCATAYVTWPWRVLAEEAPVGKSVEAGATANVESGKVGADPKQETKKSNCTEKQKKEGKCACPITTFSTMTPGGRATEVQCHNEMKNCVPIFDSCDKYKASTNGAVSGAQEAQGVNAAPSSAAPQSPPKEKTWFDRLKFWESGDSASANDGNTSVGSQPGPSAAETKALTPSELDAINAQAPAGTTVSNPDTPELNRQLLEQYARLTPEERASANENPALLQQNTSFSQPENTFSTGDVMKNVDTRDTATKFWDWVNGVDSRNITGQKPAQTYRTGFEGSSEMAGNKPSLSGPAGAGSIDTQYSNTMSGLRQQQEMAQRFIDDPTTPPEQRASAQEYLKKLHDSETTLMVEYGKSLERTPTVTDTLYPKDASFEKKVILTSAASMGAAQASIKAMEQLEGYRSGYSDNIKNLIGFAIDAKEEQLEATVSFVEQSMTGTLPAETQKALLEASQAGNAGFTPTVLKALAVGPHVIADFTAQDPEFFTKFGEKSFAENLDTLYIKIPTAAVWLGSGTVATVLDAASGLSEHLPSWLGGGAGEQQSIANIVDPVGSTWRDVGNTAILAVAASPAGSRVMSASDTTLATQGTGRAAATMGTVDVGAVSAGVRNEVGTVVAPAAARESVVAAGDTAPVIARAAAPAANDNFAARTMVAVNDNVPSSGVSALESGAALPTGGSVVPFARPSAVAGGEATGIGSAAGVTAGETGAGSASVVSPFRPVTSPAASPGTSLTASLAGGETSALFNGNLALKLPEPVVALPEAVPAASVGTLETSAGRTLTMESFGVRAGSGPALPAANSNVSSALTVVGGDGYAALTAAEISAIETSAAPVVESLALSESPAVAGVRPSLSGSVSSGETPTVGRSVSAPATARTAASPEVTVPRPSAAAPEAAVSRGAAAEPAGVAANTPTAGPVARTAPEVAAPAPRLVVPPNLDNEYGMIARALGNTALADVYSRLSHSFSTLLPASAPAEPTVVFNSAPSVASVIPSPTPTNYPILAAPIGRAWTVTPQAQAPSRTSTPLRAPDMLGTYANGSITTQPLLTPTAAPVAERLSVSPVSYDPSAQDKWRDLAEGIGKKLAGTQTVSATRAANDNVNPTPPPAVETIADVAGTTISTRSPITTAALDALNLVTKSATSVVRAVTLAGALSVASPMVESVVPLLPAPVANIVSPIIGSSDAQAGYCRGCAVDLAEKLHVVGEAADQNFYAMGYTPAQGAHLLSNSKAMADYVRSLYTALESAGMLNTTAFPDWERLYAHVAATLVEESSMYEYDTTYCSSASACGPAQIRKPTARDLGVTGDTRYNQIENIKAAVFAANQNTFIVQWKVPSANPSALRAGAAWLFNAGQFQPVVNARGAIITNTYARNVEAEGARIYLSLKTGQPMTLAEVRAMNPKQLGDSAAPRMQEYINGGVRLAAALRETPTTVAANTPASTEVAAPVVPELASVSSDQLVAETETAGGGIVASALPTHAVVAEAPAPPVASAAEVGAVREEVARAHAAVESAEARVAALKASIPDVTVTVSPRIKEALTQLAGPEQRLLLAYNLYKDGKLDALSLLPQFERYRQSLQNAVDAFASNAITSNSPEVRARAQKVRDALRSGLAALNQAYTNSDVNAVAGLARTLPAARKNAKAFLDNPGAVAKARAPEVAKAQRQLAELKGEAHNAEAELAQLTRTVPDAGVAKGFPQLVRADAAGVSDIATAPELSEVSAGERKLTAADFELSVGERFGVLFGQLAEKGQLITTTMAEQGAALITAVGQQISLTAGAFGERVALIGSIFGEPVAPMPVPENWQHPVIRPQTPEVAPAPVGDPALVRNVDPPVPDISRMAASEAPVAKAPLASDGESSPAEVQVDGLAPESGWLSPVLRSAEGSPFVIAVEESYAQLARYLAESSATARARRDAAREKLNTAANGAPAPKGDPLPDVIALPGPVVVPGQPAAARRTPAAPVPNPLDESDGRPPEYARIPTRVASTPKATTPEPVAPVSPPSAPGPGLVTPTAPASPTGGVPPSGGSEPTKSWWSRIPTWAKVTIIGSLLALSGDEWRPPQEGAVAGGGTGADTVPPGGAVVPPPNNRVPVPPPGPDNRAGRDSTADGANTRGTNTSGGLSGMSGMPFTPPMTPTTPTTQGTTASSRTPTVSCKPGSIRRGSTSPITVSWDCSGATSIRTIGFSADATALTSSSSITPTRASQETKELEYGVVCLNGTTEVGQKSCTVTVRPPLAAALLANPSTVTAGTETKLMWGLTETVPCVLYGPKGVASVSSSQVGSARIELTRSSEFVLMCDDSGTKTRLGRVVVKVAGDTGTPLPAKIVLPATSSQKVPPGSPPAASGNTTTNGADSAAASEYEFEDTSVGTAPANTSSSAGTGSSGGETSGSGSQECSPEMGTSAYIRCLSGGVW